MVHIKCVSSTVQRIVLSLALEQHPDHQRQLLLNPGNLYLGPVCMLSRLSHVRLFSTLWTVAHQTPLSMGFSRQEYWSGLPGDLPAPRIEPACLLLLLHWQVSFFFFFNTSATWVAPLGPRRCF